MCCKLSPAMFLSEALPPILGICLMSASIYNLPIKKITSASTSFQNALSPIQNDTTAKKIGRVANEILKILSHLITSVGIFMVGFEMLKNTVVLGIFSSAVAGLTFGGPVIAAGLGIALISAILGSYCGAKPEKV